jgi:8-amino-3,8-dideoxy-alpha-D-manno-octulosonate transaminase
MAGWELFDESERRQVGEVMETGVLMRYGFDGARNGRWKAREMERAIERRTGAAHALLVANGTSAITTALAALGVGAGDEVIMPPFTFVATFESIIAAGATPVIAEVDETLCLSADSVERCVTSRTKAVMPVHMCGASASLNDLAAVAKKHDLLLIEDACQAFGASYRGLALGVIGDAGCYSFDFNKLVTCGEGGAMVTNKREVYDRADMYHDHGHDHTMSDRGAEDHIFSGYNYRISELHAAVGLAQIAKLDGFLERQRANKAAFKRALAGISEVMFRKLPDPEGDSATFVSFLMPSEDDARRAARAMKDAGVGGVFHWYDNNWHYVRNWDHLKERRFAGKLSYDILNRMPDYARRNFKSDDIISRCVSITIKLGWSDEEANKEAARAADAIKSSLA